MFNLFFYRAGKQSSWIQTHVLHFCFIGQLIRSVSKYYFKLSKNIRINLIIIDNLGSHLKDPFALRVSSKELKPASRTNTFHQDRLTVRCVLIVNSLSKSKTYCYVK